MAPETSYQKNMTSKNIVYNMLIIGLMSIVLLGYTGPDPCKMSDQDIVAAARKYCDRFGLTCGDEYTISCNELKSCSETKFDERLCEINFPNNGTDSLMLALYTCRQEVFAMFKKNPQTSKDQLPIARIFNSIDNFIHRGGLVNCTVMEQLAYNNKSNIYNAVLRSVYALPEDAEDAILLPVDGDIYMNGSSAEITTVSYTSMGPGLPCAQYQLPKKYTTRIPLQMIYKKYLEKDIKSGRIRLTSIAINNHDTYNDGPSKESQEKYFYGTLWVVDYEAMKSQGGQFELKQMLIDAYTGEKVKAYLREKEKLPSHTIK